jgi:hypothetical protein
LGKKHVHSAFRLILGAGITFTAVLSLAPAAQARPIIRPVPPSPAALSLWALSPVEAVGAPPTDPWVMLESWSTPQPIAPLLDAPVSAAAALDEGDIAPDDSGDVAPPVLLHADTIAWLRASMAGAPVAPPGAYDVAMPPPDDPGCELTLDTLPALHMFDDDAWIGAPWPRIEKRGHTMKDGSYQEYDEIGRRWDRPEAYASYRYPVPNAWVASGYDLDKPDDQQRRGEHLSAIGHGGIDLAEKKGTEIRMLALDHQIGDAEVLYVGHLFGTTVVTRHTLREGGKKRDYILIFGHLEKAADNVWRGRRLRPGEVLGFVGDTDSPEFVHLHLEARRVREGVDAWKVSPWSLDAREVSVVCDPRNVLPLRIPWRPRHRCSPALVSPHPREWFRPMTLTLAAPDTGGAD